MNKIVYIVAIFVGVIASYGQATLKGKITNSQGYGLMNVNILIKKTEKGTVTDFDGNFEINDVSENEIMIISSIGFKTKELIIKDLKDTINIILYEGNELLQEVVIEGRKNSFSRKKTAYVSKLPLKNIENSQVYSTVTSDLLKSQLVTTFAEALTNAGVTRRWESTGRAGDGAGIYSIRGFSVQPQLVNGVAGSTNGFINPNNIERIEAIKGPSATLFGTSVSSYGGLINIVTKKPYKGTGGNITIAGGSFGFKKGVVDFNYGTTDNFSIRLNAGYQGEDSWQNQGFNKSFFIAPAISYKVNNRLTINASYESTTTEQTNPTMLFLNRSGALLFKNIKELNYDSNKSLTDNSITMKNPNQNYRGEIAYKISDNWFSQTIIAGAISKSKGLYTYLWPNKGTTTPYFDFNAKKSDGKSSSLNLQQNFTGDFKLGDLRNRVVVGVDYLQSQNIDKSSDYTPINNASDTQGNLVSGVPINSKVIETALSAAKLYNTDVNQNFLGIYVSDVINIMPELSLMSAVRFDRFNSKGDKNDPSDDKVTFIESTFSPKFGIVYQPILNKLSVFTNYQNSFVYVNPELVSIDLSDLSKGSKLQSYDLERANQFEAGIKSNLLNNKLDITLSYYNIKVTNKVIGWGAKKLQDGVVVSKGLDLEINASPFKGLNMRAGFSYNDSKLTESSTTPEKIGRRQAEGGPEMVYNFWGDYKITEGNFKNLGFGAGFNGASEYDTMSDNVTEGFILPAYTLFNASIYYDAKDFRIGVKGNNLSDVEYYSGWTTVNPQKPLSWLASLTYKF